MRRLAQNLVLVAVSVALTLLAAEAALRLAAHRILGFGEVISAGQVFRFDDDLLGFRLDPGSSRIHARGGAYVVRDRINSLGMRDVEHTRARPAGTRRILILGDSFMYGTGVPMETVMARRLEELLPQGTELINAAVHSYGLSHEYLYYSHRGRELSPDLVVLAFFINDVEEPKNLVIVNGPDGLPESIRMSEAGRKRLLDSTSKGIRGSISSWLRNRSMLYVLARQRIDDMMWRSTRTAGEEEGGLPATNEARVRYAPAFHTEPETRWGADWERAYRILDDLKERVERDGARLALILPPAPFQLSDEAFIRWAEWAREPLERLSRTHPQDKIRAWCGWSGTSCLDLMPFFQERERDHLYLAADYHWTEAGHLVAAEAVRDFLLSEGLLSKEP